MFSEVIIASKCGPLARIEKQAMSSKLELLKSLFKIREAPVKMAHNKRLKIKIWHSVRHSGKIS